MKNEADEVLASYMHYQKTVSTVNNFKLSVMPDNGQENLNTDKSPRAGNLYEQTTLINVQERERIASVGIGAWMIHTGLRKWNKRPFTNIFRLMAGSYLIYRGVSGNCPIYASMGKQIGDKHASSINIRTDLFIQRPRELVYAFWRNLENLPKFMSHLKEVIQLDDRRSSWTLATPGNIGTIQWMAEIVEDNGEALSWRSLPDSTIENSGKILFRDTPGGGTLLSLSISYRPPAGLIGAEIAEWINPFFKKLVQSDIKSFKKSMEGAEAYANIY